MSVGGIRMARHVALIAFVLVTLASPTLAQERTQERAQELAQDAGQQGDRGRGACRDDVQKLCAGIERGGGRIRDCLVSQKDKLSEDCRKRIDRRSE
jgi:hypothetical protein